MVRYLLRYPLLRPLPNSKEQLESTPTPKKKQRKEQKKTAQVWALIIWGTLLIAHLYSVSWEEIYLEKQFFASTRSCYSVKNLWCITHKSILFKFESANEFQKRIPQCCVEQVKKPNKTAFIFWQNVEFFLSCRRNVFTSNEYAKKKNGSCKIRQKEEKIKVASSREPADHE